MCKRLGYNLFLILCINLRASCFFYNVIRIQVALWDVWFCLFFLFSLKAKILCTNICKCTGCKNFEESPERKTLMHLADAAGKWPDQNSEWSTSWKIVCFVFQYAWLSLACVADIQRGGRGKNQCKSLQVQSCIWGRWRFPSVPFLSHFALLVFSFHPLWSSAMQTSFSFLLNVSRQLKTSFFSF